MLSSVTRPQASNVLAGPSFQQANPSTSTDSFTQQLTSALEGYLSQSGNGSHLEIDIKTTQSQDSGVRQFLVTVKNPDSSTPESPSAASGALGGGTFPGFASVPASAPPTTSASAPEATAADASASDAAPPDATPRTEVDAYWAAQPPEVQQLRDVTDFAARSAMAQRLADQGFIIDKAIMVWGWDPLKTMLTRQAYGYTWAPNMSQGNVSTPGITLIGQTPYDPKSPPAGSIAVNTDFAKGTKISDPWCASRLGMST